MFLRRVVFSKHFWAQFLKNPKNLQPRFLGNFDRIFKDSCSLQLGIFRELAGELCEPVTCIAYKCCEVENITVVKRGKRHNSWNELIIHVRKNAIIYSRLLSKKGDHKIQIFNCVVVWAGLDAKRNDRCSL